MRNIFPEKSYTQYVGEAIPRFFSKKSKLINSLKFYTVCFYCMPSSGVLKYIKMKLPITYFDLI